jgi:DNA-binding MarR family transcriptional regulator
MTLTLDTPSRLRRVITQANRRLRQSSLGDISPAQASMLGTIEKIGAPSLGEIATVEQIQPPSVTRLVATLVDKGLVTRTVDATDRRSQRVTLTSRGKKELQRIRERKTEFLEQRIGALTPQQQQDLARSLAVLEHLFGDVS